MDSGAPTIKVLVCAMTDVGRARETNEDACSVTELESGTRIDAIGADRTVEACVFNAGTEPRDKLALRLRALDAVPSPAEPTEAPPNVVSEATFALGGELAPQAGVTARVKLDVSKASSQPVAFEAFADREDLLP